MFRLFYLLIAYAICFAGISAGISIIPDLAGNVPNGNTPKKLQEAWLSFHASDLCQEVDALFVFSKTGVEVWSRIESDKAFQKFQGLFEALKSSFPVELYTTRPPAEKREDNDNENDPPPSLWQNYELRANLGDRVGLAISHLVLDEQIQLDSPPPDPSLKQRLMIYAEQTLDWNKRMERYALDLTGLAHVAHDPGVSADLRSKAITVCALHAQNLEKYIRKTAANLAQALPISEKKKRPASLPVTSIDAGKLPVEKAEQISMTAQGVSRRVHRFIHPEHYTVELDELRNPSLLESLWVLRGMVSDFRESLVKLAPK